MTERLKTITDLVQPGKGVIDVGTDHGYVPAELALRGYAGNIIASDINEGPLSAAKRYALEQNVSNRILFTLSDGLAGCSPKLVDTVIIAGMGGDLICSIIDAADWLCRPKIRLILQPMTKAEILRYYLINNGFVITDEKLVRENGRVFQIFTSEYNGVYFTRKLNDASGFDAADPYMDAELFTGRFRILKEHSEFRDMILGTLKSMEKKLNGIESSGIRKGNLSDYIFYSELLRQLREMRKRYDDL
ncbi:MAG: class I SAM-dependent methyltransferase [Eubacteriales bacterium]|nr:class I SAM-dependent methyltransferase [Eubacteriales bacterium]